MTHDIDRIGKDGGQEMDPHREQDSLRETYLGYTELLVVGSGTPTASLADDRRERS